MLQRLVKYRRDLHQIPELDRDLPQTFSYIKSVLEGLSCEVFSPCQSAICAYFDCGKPKTAAFRSDMDALPVTEHTGLPFTSSHAGCMHACGHDGHMSMLLELANEVNLMAPDLPSNILLIFQPAEETSGGAKYICQSGIFQKYNVSHIFGCHLWPSLPAGIPASRRGDMLAKSSEIDVSIQGKSTHIARAFEGRDALLSGVNFVARSYAMIENEVPASENKLLKFGHFESGTVRNAISAHTLIQGSLRSFTPSVFDFMKNRLCEIAEDIKKETGCDFEIKVGEGYPPVINNIPLYDSIKAFLGDDAFCELPEPFMIAEDFSYYGLEVPSVFFLLGTGTNEPLHSDKFDFDECVLEKGVELYKQLLRFSYNI